VGVDHGLGEIREESGLVTHYMREIVKDAALLGDCALPEAPGSNDQDGLVEKTGGM
jgi:hypothetical protein